MDTRNLFNLRGLNYWILAVGVGLNFFWMGGLLLFAFFALMSENQALAQIVALVGSFAGAFVIGWLMGKLAADGRGATYGLLGSFGSLILAIIFLVPTGIVGLMVAIVIPAGGLNGGLYSERRRPLK